MSIQDIWNKIKGVHQESPNILPISVIIALVGIGSFILGRLSVNLSIDKPKVSIVSTNTNIKDNKDTLIDTNADSYPKNRGENSVGMYIASKNGKLYYSVGCKAASRLSDKTKISWNTKEEAEAAGYLFAESCNK